MIKDYLTDGNDEHSSESKVFLTINLCVGDSRQKLQIPITIKTIILYCLSIFVVFRIITTLSAGMSKRKSLRIWHQTFQINN